MFGNGVGVKQPLLTLQVQYDGMSKAEIKAALKARTADAGFCGGMPMGAKISAEEAVRRWQEGEVRQCAM